MANYPGSKKIFFIFAFSGCFFAESAALAKSCGTVKVVAGETCQTLKVKFDLAGCGDASFERETKIDCHHRSASVLLKTDLYRYNSELFSSTNKSGKITWEVIGQMTQSDRDQVADLGSPLLPFMNLPKVATQASQPVVKSYEPVWDDETPGPPVRIQQESPGGRSLASVSSTLSDPGDSDISKETHFSKSSFDSLTSGLTFDVMLDGYYSYNFNQPQPIVPAANPSFLLPNTSVRAYDFYHNTLALNVAEITVKRSSPELSFTADFDFGPQADFNAVGLVSSSVRASSIRSADAVSKTLGQIFLTYTPDWAPRLILEFGKMASHLGYESWKSKDSWQYSRSTSYSFGLPFWHTGLHLGYDVVPDKVSFSGYVYNSWNSIYENNASKTLGAQLDWTPSETFELVYNYISGPEQTGNDTNLKWVHEANLSWTLGSRVSLALETVYGHEDGVTLADASVVNTDWIGAYLALKFEASPRYSISPRFEVYRDTTGANLGGDAQTLYGITLTNSLKVAEGFEARLELREDASTYGQEFTGATGPSNNQTTVTLGLIYSTD
jgi:hypothetical protein